MLRFSDIESDLKEQIFEFMFLYSRWEYLLKENRFLKIRRRSAEACWFSFVDEYSDRYKLTDEAGELIRLNPKRQVVGEDGKTLYWKSVGYDDCKDDLCRVVRTLQTVRNNLFHGGKHGVEDWDNRERVSTLVVLSVKVMRDLARQVEWESDLDRYY